MIRYRKATSADMSAILDLVDKSFALQGKKFSQTEGQEHRILFSYLYSRQDWNPDWLCLAETNNRIIAAVGCFPQTLSFEDAAIPVWSISPVMTDPDFRNQGLAGECLNRAIENLKEMKIPAVFLWGLPTYYPKLGFIPILPRYKTKINAQSLMDDQASSYSPGKFRECSRKDLKIISELYNRNNRILWLQPQRSLEWWQERFTEMDIELAKIKEVPFPKKENFLIWENEIAEIAGYLNYTIESAAKVIISETFATDLGCASAMIRCFIEEYLGPAQTLYIRGTPDHLSNAAAYHLGGMHLNPAPLAGMVKVIDWPLFLNFLNPLFAKRLFKIDLIHAEIDCCWRVDNYLIHFKGSGGSFKITLDETGKIAETNDNQLLTRLIFGLYERFDPEITSKIRAEYLPDLFPQKYPFIWDANYLY